MREKNFSIRKCVRRGRRRVWLPRSSPLRSGPLVLLFAPAMVGHHRRRSRGALSRELVNSCSKLNLAVKVGIRNAYVAFRSGILSVLRQHQSKQISPALRSFPGR